jgi:nickel-dependent lactate racemase
MVEMARMAKLNFIINVLLNKKREITDVFAGDLVQAHEKGCEAERKICGVFVDHKFDITITTNNGAPLDLDLYQTVKGIDSAASVTRDGGIIITASSCWAGAGPESFHSLHAAATSPIDVIQRIRREGPIGVQWENQILARLECKHDLYLVSGLPEKITRQMMLSSSSTIEDAVEKALQALGKDAEIGIIPEGSLVMPILKS